MILYFKECLSEIIGAAIQLAIKLCSVFVLIYRKKKLREFLLLTNPFNLLRLGWGTWQEYNKRIRKSKILVPCMTEKNILIAWLLKLLWSLSAPVKSNLATIRVFASQLEHSLPRVIVSALQSLESDRHPNEDIWSLNKGLRHCMGLHIFHRLD